MHTTSYGLLMVVSENPCSNSKSAFRFNSISTVLLLPSAVATRNARWYSFKWRLDLNRGESYLYKSLPCSSHLTSHNHNWLDEWDSKWVIWIDSSSSASAVRSSSGQCLRDSSGTLEIGHGLSELEDKWAKKVLPPKGEMKKDLQIAIKSFPMKKPLVLLNRF